MDELTRLKIQNAELIATLASNSQALELAEAQLLAREHELDEITQFDQELTRSDDLDYTLNHVLTWLRARVNADYGLIARWQEDRQLYQVLLARGIPLGQDYQPGEVLTLTPEWGLKMTAESHVLTDVRQTLLVCELHLADERQVGLLIIQRHSGIKFSSSEQKLIRVIANRLTISMHMSALLKRVQDMSQHRVQLFRMLSHDLRQPLTVLMGYLQLLEYKLKLGEVETAHSYVGFISTGANDLKELLEEVLLMERIANKSRADWEVVSLRSICRMALEKHKQAGDLQGHQIQLNLPEEEAYCKGIPLELKEAAGNLISNAIKYTPNGGQIQVSLWREGNRWYYQVQDNGYGIAPERQARLFESFYRAQEPGTESIKGSGLGLNLVKGIIDKHDGEVFFSSEPGQGSVFGFWLPVAPKD